jgi:hypothetical protein
MMFNAIDTVAMKARVADIGKEFPDLAPWAIKFANVK